jgi:hypothetical protein
MTNASLRVSIEEGLRSASSLATDGCLSGGHYSACLSRSQTPLHEVEHRYFEFLGGSAQTPASAELGCECVFDPTGGGLKQLAFVRPSLSAASCLASCSPASGHVRTRREQNTCDLVGCGLSRVAHDSRAC